MVNFLKGKLMLLKDKYFIASVAVATTVTSLTTCAFALDGTVTEAGTSLLDSATKQILNDFASSMKPTVLELIGIIVPASLVLWAIGFGIYKGLHALMSAAKKAIHGI